ncbi:ABC transporter permease [Xanthocytophaga agilis]|uniref:ABC transporter permease n=1 Tax=Xanthocytophaga agilis TaxID=3048010 RepID=A0AAE3RBS5_9BACT|nr:ABC transporter permease [Xanthocytophaga agilis]MDJ1504578.1 ABC transporter permease [Xanthocytophaga agilis]
MNIAAFISARIRHTEGQSFSATVAKIGVASVALGLAVMIISFAILGGFKREIYQKIFSFGGHLQVSEFSMNRSYEEPPITINTDLYKNYKNIPEVAHIQGVTQKAALIKTDTEVQGVVMKGVGSDFDLPMFAPNLREGNFIQWKDTSFSRDIVLSHKLARQLKLKINDEVLVYFMQNPPRVRKLRVSGIYETGMEEFDDNTVFCDINLLRRINDWSRDQVSTYEIFLKDFTDMETGTKKVFDKMEYSMNLVKITDKYNQIFEWLLLLNRNVTIFLALILFVACFNMVAILLILIMERTQMIGLLKAVGARNLKIQEIFLWGGLRLIGMGMLWGNLIGIGFCALQYFFKIIPLDPETYYMSTVPIQWDFPLILLLNAVVLVLVLGILVIPTLVITRINPVKAIRFD